MQTRLLLILGCLLIMGGCTTDSIKRTGYGTLQNIERQQCEKDLSRECHEQDSYETYQRKRQEQ